MKIIEFRMPESAWDYDKLGMCPNDPSLFMLVEDAGVDKQIANVALYMKYQPIAVHATSIKIIDEDGNGFPISYNPSTSFLRAKVWTGSSKIFFKDILDIATDMNRLENKVLAIENLLSKRK